jgi:hypothetical protein
LFYASLGIPVFPLVPDTKHPFTSGHPCRANCQHRHYGAVTDATRDPEIITEWFLNHPDANIGGAGNGRLVPLDVDVKGGKRGIDELEVLSGGDEPETVRVLTPSGGLHLWFLNANGAAMRPVYFGLDKSVELRGGNSYVVMPPSIVGGRPYLFEDGCSFDEIEPVALPFWLEEAVVERHRPARERGTGGFQPDTESDPFDALFLTGMRGDEFVAQVLCGKVASPLPATRRFDQPRIMRNGEIRLRRPVYRGDDVARSDVSVSVGGDDSKSSFAGYATVWSSTVIAEHETLACKDASGGFLTVLGGELLSALVFRGNRSETKRFLAAHGFGTWPPPSALDERGGDDDCDDERPSLGSSVLPEEFWRARSWLGHIRQAAHSRRTSPDAVVHAVLARISALTSFSIELPPLIGSAGSLNFFTALVAPSGAGKSASARVARELVVAPPGVDFADDLPIGSGEGIAEAFYGQVPDPENPKKKIRGVVRRHALFYVDEGEVLSELSERRGATTVSTLRSAWSGQSLGATNGAAERTRFVPAGGYRVALVVGFQPTKAARILADNIGGTPQRFLWASAVDPSMPEVRPGWPGPLPWKPIDPALMERHRMDNAAGFVRHQMTVAPEIEEEVDAAHLAKMRGEGTGSLDAHGHLHRLKVAALLAIAEGRMDINNEDWALAGIVWETSCAVREYVKHTIALDAEQVQAARLATRVRAQKAPEQASRLARRLALFVHKLGEKGAPRSELRRHVHERERTLLDVAIDEALSLEWIVAEGTRFYPGPVKLLSDTDAGST